jgi:small subunit ribosomal protein S15
MLLGSRIVQHTIRQQPPAAAAAAAAAARHVSCTAAFMSTAVPRSFFTSTPSLQSSSPRCSMFHSKVQRHSTTSLLSWQQQSLISPALLRPAAPAPASVHIQPFLTRGLSTESMESTEYTVTTMVKDEPIYENFLKKHDLQPRVPPPSTYSTENRDAAALTIVESISRLTDPDIMSQKGRFKLEVRQIIQEFGGDQFNSGLTEVQVAIMTRKIAYLSLALRDNRKDKHNIRSLNLMIGKRRKLLKYLIRQSRPRYYATIGALGLRDIYGDKVLKRKGARKKYPPSNITKF